jgi:hypothetical protein
LIFRLDDDELSDRVTLDVLNPDDNSVVYTESRDRVAVDNDVKRLIQHFLSAVDDAREAEKTRREPTPSDQSDDNSTFTSPVNDHTPSYVCVGRSEDREKAEGVAKKVEGLGLPVTVVPRPGSTGDLYIVVTGPYGPERVTTAMDYLKTQGFSDVRVMKNPFGNQREPSN